MDTDKFTDILAILMKENRTDLIDYTKKIIDLVQFLDAGHSSEEESDSEYEEEIEFSIDNDGFYSLN